MLKTHCFTAEPQPDGTVLVSRLAAADTTIGKCLAPVESWPITMAQAGIFATELFNAVREATMARVEFRTHGAESAIDEEPVA